MSDAFTPLKTELSRWRDLGLTLPIWWRDDDAVTPTAALDRLADLSQHTGVPVHLAVIPETCQPSLADWTRNAPQIVPVQHGWSHRSHAPKGEKKAEFDNHRPLPALIDDVERGQRRLNDLFGSRLSPMFVPPWNRITPDLLPALPNLRLTSVSTFTPRKTRDPAPGMMQINTHLNPIDWRGSRDLVDVDALTGICVQHLTDRRTGTADNTEPYGLLTHHLVHTEAIWSWTEAFLNTLLAGPVRICHPTDMIQGSAI